MFEQLFRTPGLAQSCTRSFDRGRGEDMIAGRSLNEPFETSSFWESLPTRIPGTSTAALNSKIRKGSEIPASFEKFDKSLL
jgi:hypothetical protein